MQQIALPMRSRADGAVSGTADPMLRHLALRLQDADETALEPFVRATQGVAHRLAASMLGDHHAAQDVLQDAYLIVLEDIHTLKNPGAIKSWFMRIVTNRCLELLRKRRSVSLHDLPSGELADSGQLPERTGRRLAMQQALQALSSNDRAVLLLRDALELSYEEVAEVLKVPLGTVKRRLHEARRRLTKGYMQS